MISAILFETNEPRNGIRNPRFSRVSRSRKEEERATSILNEPLSSCPTLKMPRRSIAFLTEDGCERCIYVDEKSSCHTRLCFEARKRNRNTFHGQRHIYGDIHVGCVNTRMCGQYVMHSRPDICLSKPCGF